MDDINIDEKDISFLKAVERCNGKESIIKNIDPTEKAIPKVSEIQKTTKENKDIIELDRNQILYRAKRKFGSKKDNDYNIIKRVKKEKYFNTENTSQNQAKLILVKEEYEELLDKIFMEHNDKFIEQYSDIDEQLFVMQENIKELQKEIEQEKNTDSQTEQKQEKLNEIQNKQKQLQIKFDKFEKAFGALLQLLPEVDEQKFMERVNQN